MAANDRKETERHESYSLSLEFNPAPMGKVLSIVRFDFPAPRPEVIALKASEICGLAIRYERNEHTLDEVHEFSGKLYFESMPDEKIDVYSYRQGAVKRFDEKMGMPDHPAMMKKQGYFDDDGVQRVYLETYIGCELTLFHITELTLVKLGGRPERENSNPIEHDKILSEDELQARFLAHRKFHRKNRPLYILCGLFIVLTLPFHMLWALVSMPFKLLDLRRKHPELFNKGKKEPPGKGSDCGS